MKAQMLYWYVPLANRRVLTLGLPEDVNLRDLEFVRKYLDLVREALEEDAKDAAAAKETAAELSRLAGEGGAERTEG